MKQKHFDNLEDVGALPLILIVTFGTPIALGINLFLATRVGYAFSEAMNSNNNMVGILIVYFMSMLGILNSVFRSKGYGNEERADSQVNTTLIDRISLVTSKEYSRRERDVISISFLGYLMLQFLIIGFCSLHFEQLRRVSASETVICWFVGMLTDFLTGFLYAYWKEKSGDKKKAAKVETKKPEEKQEKKEQKTEHKVTKLPALPKTENKTLREFKDKLGKNKR